MFTRKLATVTAALVATGALALSGCSPALENDSTQKVDTASDTSVTTNTGAASEESESSEAPVLSLKEPFIKAKADDSDMTAIFGVLVNNSSEDILITGFSTSLGAPVNEIHETKDGVMRELEGGLPIAAHSQHELKPGGDHFMLMGINQPIQAGDTVDLVVNLSDGTSVEFDDIEVRTIASGQESYGEDGSLQGHNGVDHNAS